MSDLDLDRVSGFPDELLDALLAAVLLGMRELARNGRQLPASMHALVGYLAAARQQRSWPQSRVAPAKACPQSPGPSSSGDVLTTAEVAARLGVSERTARRRGRLRSGGARAIPGMPGRHLLFDRAAVEREAAERGRSS